MAARCQAPAPPAVAALLAHAQAETFSAQGELFSCWKMKELAEKFIPGSKADVIKNPQSCHVTRHLLKGGVALVPYDKDRNFGPTLRQGNKAHWAVLLGCLALVPSTVIQKLTDRKLVAIDLLFEAEKTSMLQTLQSSGVLLLEEPRVNKCDTQGDSDSTLNHVAINTIHLMNQPSLYRSASPAALGDDVVDDVVDLMLTNQVIALQGKSRNLLFWDLDELLLSNAQLTSYDTSAVDGELIFPDGDIGSGLCNQLVLLEFGP